MWHAGFCLGLKITTLETLMEDMMQSPHHDCNILVIRDIMKSTTELITEQY